MNWTFTKNLSNEIKNASLKFIKFVVIIFVYFMHAFATKTFLYQSGLKSLLAEKFI